MRTFVGGALAVLWVAALLGFSMWLRARSRSTSLDRKAARERRRAELDRRRPERDLERVVREATVAGAVVAVARRGANPVRVTWSDGSVWLYYEDEARHADAQQRGMVPPGITRVGPPPEIGTPRPAR